MSYWNLRYSYKYDLAGFCNLFTCSEQLIELHKEGYESFIDLIDSRPDLVELARGMQQAGFDPRVILVSVFDMVDHHGSDMDVLCSLMEQPEKRELLKRYYVEEEQLVTDEIWHSNVEPLLPMLSNMVRYVHENGFHGYWVEVCEPKLESRIEEFKVPASEYDIVGEINDLLGPKYHLPLDEVTLYISPFSAPFGTKLRSQSFLADARWEFENMVAIALHELMHPPFSRDRIKDIAEYLWEDDLLQEAFGAQPPNTTYNTPLRFLEENLTEGAHVHLAEEMGVLKEPLKYLAEHDHGSHVVSVLLYHRLKSGIMDQFDSLEEAVEHMVVDGTLVPGNLRNGYRDIYATAGVEAPF